MLLLRAALLVLAIATLTFAGGLYSLPVQPCATASAAQWEAWAAAGGCRLGDSGFAVYNFSFNALVNPSQPGSNVATDLNVLITPGAGLTDGLTISSTLGNDVFNLAPFDFAFYTVRYTIDPPPPIMPGFDMELDVRSPVAPGKAVVTANVCAAVNQFAFVVGGPVCSNGSPVYTAQVFHLGSPGNIRLNDSITFLQPANFVDVSLSIELNTLEGGTAQIDGVRPAPQVTPEPAPAALIGAAGLGLLWWRRRR